MFTGLVRGGEEWKRLLCVFYFSLLLFFFTYHAIIDGGDERITAFCHTTDCLGRKREEGGPSGERGMAVPFESGGRHDDCNTLATN